jgi:hypothetical protein
LAEFLNNLINVLLAEPVLTPGNTSLNDRMGLGTYLKVVECLLAQLISVTPWAQSPVPPPPKKKKSVQK